jgi:hypothetical protein
MSKRNRQLIRRAEREKNNPNFSPYVKHRKHVSGLNKMPDKEIEVIGNVHDNPELLEVPDDK